MKFKFNAPRLKFKAPNIGGGKDAAVFGVESQGVTVETQMDQEQWGIFRRVNNREVAKRRPSLIHPMNANFVKRLMPEPGFESFLLLNGNCQGVDALCAMIEATTAKHGPPSELILSSLSMNMDTWEKLERLPVRKHLLISSYFLATNPKNLVGRLHREGKLGNWSIGMWRNHTKHALWRCGDQFYFFHGSANLRSSGSIESLSWYNNRKLYEFNRAWMLHLTTTNSIDKFLKTGKTNANGFFTFIEKAKVAVGMESDGLDLQKIREYHEYGK